MEEFWKDINHVPLITTTTHSVPCSSSSSASSPPPPSASKLHEFFTQPLRITSDTNPSLVTSSASLFPNSSASSHSKRLSEPDGGDRRSKRMIKNRESAARSRARKQAYTKELEKKLALLKEENAELTKQLEQVDEASATNKHKLKRPPYRTLTAPF